MSDCSLSILAFMAAKPASSEPRKTPRQTRAVATVAAILEAAARIIEESGLAAFNTNRTAERAGVSIGSLYQYFPTKEAILSELIRRERSALLVGVKAAAGRGQRLEATIDGLISAGLAHQLARPRLSVALDSAAVFQPLDNEDDALGEAIADELAAVLSAHAVSQPAQSARDLVALARGMIDAAGLRGETDAAALGRRVRRAALGYLNYADSAPTQARVETGGF